MTVLVLFQNFLELLFQTFVSFNFIDLILNCSSTNLEFYLSCSRTVVPDIISFNVVELVLKCCCTNLGLYKSCSGILVLEQY